MDRVVAREGSTASDDLRRRLLDAAIELLREPDTPLDLRKVAERAGKSRTAPYLVFGKGPSGGVMALRIAVAAEGSRLMQEAMVEAYAPEEDPFDSFRSVAAAFLRFVEANPRLFRLMYGPEINAIAPLGEGGFREHPEFQKLLEHRDRAGAVVTQLIHDAQDAGLLPEDPGEGDPAYEEVPSVRYLQIAWAAMIGVSVLRDDDLLKAIGWDVSIEQGARSIAESVLGVDPERTQGAVRTFLVAQSKAADSKATDGTATESKATDSKAGEGVEGESGGQGVPAPEVTWSGGEALLQRSRRGPAAAPPPPEAAPPPPAFGPPVAPATPKSPPPGEPPVREPGSERGSRARSTFGRVFRQLRPHRAGDFVEPGESAGLAEPTGSADPRLQRSSLAPDGEPSLTEALDRYSGLRRAAYSKGVLRGAKILWIDDNPASVESTAATFRHLGAKVVVVTDTSAALDVLRAEAGGRGFQVVVSDIARGADPQAGTDAIPLLRDMAPDVPIVFGIGNYDPDRGVPPGAFGITDSLDELFHLVLDALEGR
jgi:CheY-like chemotaxis protein/AcrR family transcriptional regulator